MKTKRIISALCLVVILFATLAAAGCAKPNNNTTDTTIPSTATSDTTSGNETERLYPNVSDINYNDKEFTILRYDSVKVHTWSSSIPNDIAVEKDNGETLNDAVYERNRTIQDKIGIKIVSLDKNNSEVTNGLDIAMSSQDPLYDAVIHCINSMSSMFGKQLLDDFNNYDIDLSNPWWDSNASDSFTISNKIFGAVSDATFVDKLSTVVTFYNKSYATKLGIGDMYQLVDNGEWTYEKMMEYASLASVENGDGIYDEKDAYGISCQNDGSYYLLHSAGITVVNRDADKGFVLALNNDRAISTIQTIFDLMNNKQVYYNRQVTNLSLTDTMKMFASDNALFMIRPLQSLYELRNVETTFGIIPNPKFFNDQENYCSSVNPYSATIFCLPRYVQDKEMTAIVLELMSAESYYNLMPPFYDEVLDTKYVSDPLVSKMLDIVFDNRIYDFGLAWNFGNIRSELVKASPDSGRIASIIKTLEKPITTAIQTLITTVDNFQ